MTPERTGRTATCTRCGRTDVPTERRGAGVEVLALHAVAGGTVTCHRGSGQPVQRGAR